MKLESQEILPKKISGGAFSTLLLSSEFRWIYQLSIGLFVLLSMALLTVGINNFVAWNSYFKKEPGFLTNAVLYSCGGLLFLFLAVVVWRISRSLRSIADISVGDIKLTLSDVKESDFATIDKINLLREEKARVDFERNSSDAFLIKTLELNGVGFFGPCSWQLRPGVNVLLGRNGYGKSLILRSLAALLQRNEEASKDLFTAASGEGFLHLSVERNGTPEVIRRESLRFTESPGKIPILAIPDSRFVNRSDTMIEAPTGKHKDDALDLRAEGARHFLEDRPYGEMMRMFFNELCFDYLERKSFDQPVFGLLQRAIQELTGDRFRFHSVERVGRNAFRLLVLTEGNERPLPIQYASQGTLSVLGVVGIIRSYLKALFPGARDEEFLKKPAIVLIDELDAHLHPLWQQKLTGLLRTNFPNVQFVLSAHSPLVVAGCWIGEVAVLRKGPQGLVIEQLERDFLGASVEEIHKVIFGVEAVDESYLQSASRATSGFSHQERIAELEKKEEPTELERRELPRLIREESMIVRAAEINTERKDDQDRIMELEAKVEALEDKLRQTKTP